MRSQQTSIFRENVFYPDIEPHCNDSAATSRRSDKSDLEKVAMCITATGRRQPACDRLQVGSVKNVVCQPESQQDCPRDKASLAQPAFLHEKKDRPFKRHAGDFPATAENSLCALPEKRLRSSSFTFRPSPSSSDIDHRVLEKRVRSSSFTLLTSFPPNQPVLKNNVFMPASLLRGQGGSADAGNLPSWTVIRPATLQPPPITIRRDVEKTEAAAEPTRQDKTHVDKSSAPASNADQPKSSPGSACTFGIAIRMQPFQQMFMPHKYNVDFVFGENMERRVMSPKRPTASPTNASKREVPSPRGSCHRNWPYQRRRTQTSLIESAAAYTSRPKLKYELDQVDVITGEESERNVLQVNCKLFVFSTESQSWTERGRGYLRVNDTASNGRGLFRSRIVMRNHGNLKLILNSKVYDEMILEKANRRSVRITATDLADRSVRIFLVQAGVKDAARLYAAIHHRLIALRSQRDQDQEQSGPNPEMESRIHPLNSDSEDDEDDEMLLYPSTISAHHQWIRRQPVLYS